MRFFHYITLCDGSHQSADQFYPPEAEAAEAAGDIPYQGLLCGEYFHIKHGRSYCKVYPAMAAMLQHTNIDIPVEQLPVVYPVFEIRLAEPITLPSAPTTPVRSILVVRNESLGPLLYLVCQTSDGVSFNCGLPLVSGTFQSQIEQAAREHPEAPQDAHVLVSLAIAVIFFMANEHELVAPDVEPRKVVTKAKEQRRKNSHSHVQGARLTLGREMELPAPIHEYLHHASSSHGRELSRGHLRRGHLRQQPIGPKSKDQRQLKLIWIAPTIVRPDLEMQAPRYRIPDPAKSVY